MLTSKKGIHDTMSSLSPKNLEDIVNIYHIGDTYRPQLPGPGQVISRPPTGFVGVYCQFLKAGLRFPVFKFLKVVLNFYSLHISQITPNGFRKIIGFVMLCRGLCTEPDLAVFRHFYVTMSSGDWVSFSLRHNVKDICDGVPNSIKKWKREYFFVDARDFPSSMEFGETQARDSDLPPELLDSQKDVYRQMSSAVMRWIDPNEVLLGMAGLSPYWSKQGKSPTFIVGDKTLSLLDRLSGERYAGAIQAVGDSTAELVDADMETDSSIDSTIIVTAGVSNSSRKSKETTKTGRFSMKLPRIPSKGSEKKLKTVEGVAEPLFDMFETSDSALTIPTTVSASPVSADHKAKSPTTKRRKLRRMSKSTDSQVEDGSGRDLMTVEAPVSPTISGVLHDCPIVSDPTMTDSIAITTQLSSGLINFPSSHLDVGFGSSGNVDLPLSMEEGPIPDPIVVPPVVCLVPLNPTPVIPPLYEKSSSLAAFHRKIFGSSAGAFVPKVCAGDVIVSVGSEGPYHASLLTKTCTGSANVMVPSFSEFSQTSSLLHPSPSGIPPKPADVVGPIKIGNEAPIPIPTLATMAPTGFKRVPDLTNLSNEEALDRAQTEFLNAFSVVNAVVHRSCDQLASAQLKEMEFQRQARTEYNLLQEKNLGLNQVCVQLGEENRRLKGDIEELNRKEVELRSSNDEMGLKTREALDRCLALTRSLEENTATLEGLKASFAEETSSLNVACLEKDVQLRVLKKQLSLQQKLSDELVQRSEALSNECWKAKQQVVIYQQMSERHSGDLSWLLKKGISLVVRSLFHTDEFGELNASLQLASVQLGLHKCCAEMMEKFGQHIPDEPIMHSYPGVEDEIMKKFAHLVDYKYPLLESLETGSLGVEELRKTLGDREDDPVGDGASSSPK